MGAREAGGSFFAPPAWAFFLFLPPVPEVLLHDRVISRENKHASCPYQQAHPAHYRRHT